MAYYQKQTVGILVHLSEQVYSIAPQESIPFSPPPPPYHSDFTPKPSDVRAFAYLWTSLIISLSVAFIATLIKRWGQNYMQVFEHYDNPLKGARLRQYLYEGAEKWKIFAVRDYLLGIFSISLLLFYLSTTDSFVSQSATRAVGIATIVPIAICVLFYVFNTFAPILDPQSPFRTPLSGWIWYLKQKLHPRTYLDRASGGALRTVSSDISEGQMQLAMEENEDRKHRDVRALQRLIENRTEDDELDSLVVAIPGAFTSKWGVEVWKKVANVANSSPNDATDRPQTDANLQVSNLPHHHEPPLPQHTRHPRSPLHSSGQSLETRTMDRVPHDVTVTEDERANSSSNDATGRPQTSAK